MGRVQTNWKVRVTQPSSEVLGSHRRRARQSPATPRKACVSCHWGQRLIPAWMGHIRNLSTLKPGGTHLHHPGSRLAPHSHRLRRRLLPGGSSCLRGCVLGLVLPQAGTESSAYPEEEGWRLRRMAPHRPQPSRALTRDGLSAWILAGHIPRPPDPWCRLSVPMRPGPYHRED